jgi:geranylgeranyl reductase family protein
VERFDVLVVGAGPAGSTAAHGLARAGASVLLADRARFPRDKPCGGGVTYRALRQLPVAIDPVVEDVVDRFVLRLGYRRSFERSSKEPLCLMTQRRRLDAHLAEQAAARGADFRDGVKVSDLALSKNGVTARVDAQPVEARALIGADGVNGVTARCLGFGSDYEHGVALEGNVQYGIVDPERYRGRLVLELGIIPGGYGWVFPKGDHVNIGVGGWASEGPRLREHLRRLCSAHGVAASTLADLRGYRLPLRRPESPLAEGCAALVGDAAGLVDPLTGDGIYEALLSARLAATAVLDLLAGRAADLSAYEQTATRALAPLLNASWRAKLAHDRFPRLTFAAAQAPPSWSVIERIVRGDISSPTEARGLARAPLRLIDALGRRLPAAAATARS